MSSSESHPFLEGIRAEMKRRGIEPSPEQLAELGEAMAHPQAAATIQEILAREPGSPKPGDPAPDFSLPRLRPEAGEPVRLSDHFGRRPVALIFGSYT